MDDVQNGEVTEVSGPSDFLSRGSVDNLLRTTQQNLVHLSAMADQKANIVLGASSIMLTIIVGISSSSGLTGSLASLGVFTAIAAIFALLAVMPSIPSEDTSATNPLFFGDISRMEPDEHRRLLGEFLADDQTLYDLLITDIWQSAHVLQARKFVYLRVSYTVFILGLVVTAVVMVFEWTNGTI